MAWGQPKPAQVRTRVQLLSPATTIVEVVGEGGGVAGLLKDREENEVVDGSGGSGVTRRNRTSLGLQQACNSLGGGARGQM